MITVSKDIIKACADKGKEFFSEADIIDLVNETKGEAKMKGDTVPTVLYHRQIESNTFENLVLSCLVADHMGISLRIDRCPPEEVNE